MLSRKNIVSLFVVASVMLLLATELRAAEGPVQSVTSESPIVVTNEGGAPASESVPESAPVSTTGAATASSVTVPALPSAAPSAPAQTPVTVPDSASVSTSVPSMGGDGVGKQVVEINERMALLSAQLAELELRAKIAAKVAEINNIGKKDKTEEKKSPELVSSLGQGFMNQGSGVIAPSQPAVPPLPKQSSSATVVMPVIQSIEGVDGHLKATLRVSGQGSKTVRVGQTVAGWAVRDIRIDGVTVQKGKVVQELYFEDSSRDVGAIDTSAAPAKTPFSSSPFSGPNFFGGASPASMGIEPLSLK